MRHKKFNIQAYKALVDSGIAVLETPVPIIGVNESGKSSALEAIAHFDFRNDEIIERKGWKYSNRYKPEDTKFSIECEVEISQAELDAIRKPFLLPQPEPTPEPDVVEEVVPPNPTPETSTGPATTEEPTEPAVAPATPPAPPPTEPPVDELNDIALDRDTLKIVRTFNTQDGTTKYSINGIDNDRMQDFTKAIISKLARIYYFDNFLETPLPDSISFSKAYIDGTDNSLNEAQSIIEGAFSDTGVNLREYFKNKDADSQATLISRVNDNVTKKIIDDWRKMHLPAGAVDLNKYNTVKIAFKLGENKRSIEIKIIEQFPGKDGSPNPEVTMKLTERSLGFRWFFNFSARKCFAAVHEEQFLYLIDEPGSYLHNSAQTVLLDALISLADNHPVVYSTHSEFLLDPEKININRIKVVQKEDHAIRLIPLGNASTKKHEGALSTLYNALRMRTPLESVINKKVIVTEGLTDFYFWKPILDIAFLPGCGAGSNRYLISIAIGASKKYVALFDGDTAGDEAQTHYKGLFGEEEARNWMTYSNSTGQATVLEKLLSAADATRIKSITGQNDVKQAITFLFFEGKTDEFWKGIDAETKVNVQHNINSLATTLGLTASNVGQGFSVTTTPPASSPPAA